MFLIIMEMNYVLVGEGIVRPQAEERYIHILDS